MLPEKKISEYYENFQWKKITYTAQKMKFFVKDFLS